MSLTRALLQQSRHRGELIAMTIDHRAQNVVVSEETGVPGPAARSRRAGVARVGALFRGRRLRGDRRSAPARSSRTAIRRASASACPTATTSASLAEASGSTQLRAVYQTERMLEWRQPMLLGDTPFADMRVGQSRCSSARRLTEALKPAALAAAIALLVAVIVAVLLAQVVVRPIHVIRSGLSRLGRGDLGATLDLKGDEFKELGDVFASVTNQLKAAHARTAPSGRSCSSCRAA